ANLDFAKCDGISTCAASSVRVTMLITGGWRAAHEVVDELGPDQRKGLLLPSLEAPGQSRPSIPRCRPRRPQGRPGRPGATRGTRTKSKGHTLHAPMLEE